MIVPNMFHAFKMNQFQMEIPIFPGLFFLIRYDITFWNPISFKSRDLLLEYIYIETRLHSIGNYFFIDDPCDEYLDSYMIRFNEDLVNSKQW